MHLTLIIACFTAVNILMRPYSWDLYRKNASHTTSWPIHMITVDDEFPSAIPVPCKQTSTPTLNMPTDTHPILKPILQKLKSLFSLELGCTCTEQLVIDIGYNLPIKVPPHPILVALFWASSPSAPGNGPGRHYTTKYQSMVCSYCICAQNVQKNITMSNSTESQRRAHILFPEPKASNRK